MSFFINILSHLSSENVRGLNKISVSLSIYTQAFVCYKIKYFLQVFILIFTYTYTLIYVILNIHTLFYFFILSYTYIHTDRLMYVKNDWVVPNGLKELFLSVS